MKTAKKISGRNKETVSGLLRGLLEAGAAENLFAAAENKRGDSFAFYLMGKGQVPETLDPIPPVMSRSAAGVIRSLTARGPLARKTLAVLRPCELRALVELKKLNQVDTENLITVSFDCPGIFPLKTFFKGNTSSLREAHEKALADGHLEGARPVCEICTGFTGEGADLEIASHGVAGDAFWVIAHTDAGLACLEAIDAPAVEDLSERDKALQAERERRQAVREERLAGFQDSARGPENLMKVLQNCLNCHNCMRICPICICQECYFESNAFRGEADRFLKRSERKGGLSFPSDVLLFHLGRMTHMSISCVSCGACEDACPADVSVSLLFSLVGKTTQELFDYVPGRDPAEPVPYLHFEREEFQEFEVPYVEQRTES